MIDGPTPVEECLEASVPLTHFRDTSHPIAMLGRARQLAMATHFQEADDLLEEARQLIIERFRVRRLVMFADWAAGEVHALAGRTPYAIRAYRKSLERARADGEHGHTAELTARLALLHAGQGRLAEGGDLAAESRAAAPSGHVAVQALSRAANARTMMGKEPADALAPARQAVELAPAQLPDLHAETTLHLAVVEHGCGMHDHARSQRDLAVHPHEQKGNLAAATLAQSTVLD